MSTPSYVTSVDVYSTGTAVPVVQILSSPKTYISWSALTDVDKDRLAVLASANGGTLPLSDVTKAKTTHLDNGSTWYDTYWASTFTPHSTAVGDANVMRTTTDPTTGVVSLPDLEAEAVRNAVANGAKQSGAVVVTDDNGDKYALLPLDSNGNILANVSMRSATSAALATLGGAQGELAVASDINAVFRYTGVPGDAEMVDSGAVFRYTVPAGTVANITIADNLPPHTVLYVDAPDTVTHNGSILFLSGYVPTKVGQRYRVVNRTSMWVNLYDGDGHTSSSATNIAPQSLTDFIATVNPMGVPTLYWEAYSQVRYNDDDNSSAFIVPGSGTGQSSLPVGSLAVGINTEATLRNQTLIGFSALAPAENSFAYGFPGMYGRVVRYEMAMFKNMNTSSQVGVLTSDGTDPTVTYPYKQPVFTNINNSIWRFDVDVIVKQLNSTNCGCVRYRVLVSVNSSGTPTIVDQAIVDETWSGLTLTAAANIAISIDSTYMSLKIQATNPATATTLRWRAFVSAHGVTNIS